MDYETLKLENMIQEIRSCCEERDEAEARRFGLPFGEIELLKLLGEDRYATVTGLSYKLGVAKSRVTRLFSGLLKKGYVYQTEDPEDGRVKLIGLTSEGRELLKRIKEYERGVYERLSAYIGEEDRPNILKALDLLRMAMEKVKKEL